MNELIVALALYLFGRDGAVVPLRPAPMVIEPGGVDTLEDPLPYVLYEAAWGA